MKTESKKQQEAAQQEFKKLMHYRTVTRDLMKQYLIRGWSIDFINSTRVLGRCDFRYNILSLSTDLIKHGTDVDVMDTIKHELAHIMAGGYNGHNSIWRNCCNKLGCIPRATKTVMLPEKYIGYCPTCGYEHPAKQKLKRSCGICNPNGYNEKYRIQFKAA